MYLCDCRPRRKGSVKSFTESCRIEIERYGSRNETTRVIVRRVRFRRQRVGKDYAQEIEERHHDEERRNERTSGYPIKQCQYDRDDEENPSGDLQQVRPYEQLRPHFSEPHWLPLRRHESPSPILLGLSPHCLARRILALEPVGRTA
jgi:hypothetical protein